MYPLLDHLRPNRSGTTGPIHQHPWKKIRRKEQWIFLHVDHEFGLF
jgi:hypothetical protein